MSPPAPTKRGAADDVRRPDDPTHHSQPQASASPKEASCEVGRLFVNDLLHAVDELHTVHRVQRPESARTSRPALLPLSLWWG